tara:strand:- start:181 stop:894 length:714 start_codon:yes stop_codon:yes gene_type:complete
MELFYDGCCPIDYQELLNSSLITGVTTNTSFVVEYARNNNYTSAKDALMPIISAVRESSNSLAAPMPFSFQPSGCSNLGEYLSQARVIQELYGLDNLFIKVPVQNRLMPVIKGLIDNGFKVNATCITSAVQALCALNAGASIISFFWGKMSDENLNPSDEIKLIRSKIDNAFEGNVTVPKILVGSIRQPYVAREALQAGADILTAPKPMLVRLVDQNKSLEAADIFSNTWQESGIVF